MSRAMLAATLISTLVFLYAFDYVYFAICGQAGFTLGLLVGRVIGEKRRA
jgi:hypothetical protein